MLNLITDNIATILISLILIGIILAVIHVIRRDKKKGKSICGGNCGHCPMDGSCHSK